MSRHPGQPTDDEQDAAAEAFYGDSPVTVELTAYEAEILIAVLTFAEGAALVENPAMVEAMRQLRPWRSALLQAYLRERLTAVSESL